MPKPPPSTPPKRTPSTPKFIEPMALQAVTRLPSGQWLYELKFDGYRALLIKNGARVELRSRKNKDLTVMYPAVTTAAHSVTAEQAVVDGEIVVLDENGRPSFQALQHRGRHPRHQVVFYAFDVLHVDGRDTTKLPLEERRAKLYELVHGKTIRISEELPGTASEVVAVVKSMGLEGVVAKRKGSEYVPGTRSNDWLKLKFENQQEFVLGGYRPDGENSIDALIVGYYEQGKLKFAAKVRAGLIAHAKRDLAIRLKPLRSSKCPFSDLPSGKSQWGGGVTAEEMQQMQWVTTTLVVQVRFLEWTAEGRLRHAAYLGLRFDKSPIEVKREDASRPEG